MRYVMRNGKMVPKWSVPRQRRKVSDFPSPRVSRFDAYQSPIDDRWITSDRERERDLARNDAFDKRDMPVREADHGRTPTPADTPFRWGALDSDA